MSSCVPQELLPKLASLSPYTLVVLRKGPNYENEDTTGIIQAEHLPYVFKQREEGHMVLTFPIQDQTELAAIGIYNTLDKELVKSLTVEDPAVKAGVFTYEIVSGVGLKGDILP